VTRPGEGVCIAMTNVTEPVVAVAGTEQVVGQMWRDLLGVTKTGPEDNFFDLGGTSLTAIKLLQRVEKTFGADVLSPDALYGDPRLGAVARVIDQARGSG
jgi:acyl carrier protein